MENWLVVTLAVIILFVFASLVGAIYFEPTADYILFSTNDSIFQGAGEYVGNILHDLGHSLRIGWIFAGIFFFVVAIIIVYIKTRPRNPYCGHYGYYR